MLTVHPILRAVCERSKRQEFEQNFFASTGRESNPGVPRGRREFLVVYQFCLRWRVLFSVYFHMQFSLQVSLWGFTGSIPPTFVLKLYSSRPLTKIWKNYKDEMKWRHCLFGNWKTVFEYPPLEKFMHFVFICICILFWFSLHLLLNLSS